MSKIEMTGYNGRGGSWVIYSAEHEVYTLRILDDHGSLGERREITVWVYRDNEMMKKEYLPWYDKSHQTGIAAIRNMDEYLQKFVASQPQY